MKLNSVDDKDMHELQNMVMQLRKIVNHPQLFNRNLIQSPFMFNTNLNTQYHNFDMIEDIDKED